MPEDVMIDVQNVTKRYGRKRRVEALRGITLQIESGTVTAVVGPNGAGKSTLFGVILGFLRPSTGSVSIREDDPRGYVLDNGIGYLPDRFSLPPGWPVGRAFDALAQLNGLSRTHTDAALSAFGLEDQRNKKIGELSRGLLQRLGLAHAFAPERELLVLDEPAEGLDPFWRIRLRDLITEHRAAGRTVLIASHDLAEVERIADRVVVLEQGSVKDILELNATYDSATLFRITLARPIDRFISIFPGATAFSDTEYAVPVTGVSDLNNRLGALLDLGALVTSVTSANTLEQHVRKAIES